MPNVKPQSSHTIAALSDESRVLIALFDWSYVGRPCEQLDIATMQPLAPPWGGIDVIALPTVPEYFLWAELGDDVNLGPTLRLLCDQGLAEETKPRFIQAWHGRLPDGRLLTMHCEKRSPIVVGAVARCENWLMELSIDGKSKRAEARLDDPPGDFYKLTQAGIAEAKRLRESTLANAERAGADRAEQASPTGYEPKRRKAWLGPAILALRDHPDWSNAQIAKHVKVHPSALSRDKQYQNAANLARQATVTRGYIKRNSGSGDAVEAISDHD